ncbi:MAG: hypothetical protein F6K19_31290 [Cyanothece sp. SIO1E1]|nr:hypothetical protein [Cyanothece sp. SIO1E1]
MIEQLAPGAFKPYAQSLDIDRVDQPDAPATPIHLEYWLGGDRLMNGCSICGRSG